MPLEFALRPHIDLERPLPRKRKRPNRTLRMAVPVAAYWLAIAGATHLFLESTKGRSALAHERVPNEPAFEPAPVVATEPARSEPPVTNAEPNAPLPARAAPRAAALPSLPLSPVARATPHAPDPKPFSAEPRPRRSEPPLAPAASFPERDEPPDTSLPSCETAANSAQETIDMDARNAAPDLPREAFAAVLDRGGYLARCAVPASTALDICAAVQDGKVVGVSVSSLPQSASVNACVRRAVAALRFPNSARLDVARTRFGRVR